MVIDTGHLPKAKNTCSALGHAIIGFTLVEVLVAMAIAGIVTGTIINMFINYRNSSQVQLKIAGLQQNLRVAMNVIADDIRKAGLYTRLDGRAHQGYVDWNPEESGCDIVQWPVCGVDNLTGLERYGDGTDVIMIVKSGDDRGVLCVGEYAATGSQVLNLNDLDLDDDGDDDVNTGGRRFGVLVKSDLSASHLFKITAAGDESGASRVHVAETFPERYAPGDIIARVDMIVYRIDPDNASFDATVLERKNAGNGNTFQVVAEDITDLQFAYLLEDGRTVADPSGMESVISAVFITIEGSITIPGQRERKRRLENMVRIRNAGI